jgi:hypothetical protein
VGVLNWKLVECICGGREISHGVCRDLHAALVSGRHAAFVNVLHRPTVMGERQFRLTVRNEADVVLFDATVLPLEDLTGCEWT